MKCVDQGQYNSWIPETNFIFLAPQHVTEAAYKGLVLLILEYGSSVRTLIVMV